MIGHYIYKMVICLSPLLQTSFWISSWSFKINTICIMIYNNIWKVLLLNSVLFILIDEGSWAEWFKCDWWRYPSSTKTKQQENSKKERKIKENQKGVWIVLLHFKLLIMLPLARRQRLVKDCFEVLLLQAQGKGLQFNYKLKKSRNCKISQVGSHKI